MGQKEQIKLFEQKRVRSVWDEEKEEWFFSVIDVVEVLTDSTNPTDSLKKMRKRDPELGIYIGTNCPQVAMATATGKKRRTLAANAEQLFRIIQSIIRLSHSRYGWHRSHRNVSTPQHRARHQWIAGRNNEVSVWKRSR